MSRRCAIYARYSSDLQRETSIEDQLRRCREYAARREWPIVEDFVVADRAVSAASVAGRNGLQRLVQAAKVKPRPFDTLLVDDTSRLARDLSDALRTLKILEFYGVTIVSVSQGIDSAQGNARPLLAMHGIMAAVALGTAGAPEQRRKASQVGKAEKGARPAGTSPPSAVGSTSSVQFRRLRHLGRVVECQLYLRCLSRFDINRIGRRRVGAVHAEGRASENENV